MLRRTLWLAIGVIVALTTLVWQFPARGLLLLLPSAAISSTQHRVHAVEGTLWRGAASISFAAVPSLQRIQWSCSPRALGAAIECELEGSAQGTLIARPLAATLELRNLKFQSALQFAPNPNVNAASESLAIAIESGTLSRNTVALKGNLLAKDFVVASPALTPNRIVLGEVFVECQPDSAQPTATCVIKNRGSASKLDGTLSIAATRASGSLEFTLPGASPLKFGF